MGCFSEMLGGRIAWVRCCSKVLESCNSTREYTGRIWLVVELVHGEKNGKNLTFSVCDSCLTLLCDF